MGKQTIADDLIYALENGIIDIGTIQSQIEMKRRKELLEMHKNKVWQGKNGKWYTELPATEYSKRRLVKKTRREDLDDTIAEFYKSLEEDRTVGQMYKDWINQKVEWNEISPGTVNRYQTDYDRFIKGTSLERTRIDLVTTQKLEDFIKKTIADKRITNKTYGGLRTILMGTFKYAKSNGYTKMSVSEFFADIQLSRRAFKKTAKKVQVFDDGETEKIKLWIQEHPTLMNMSIALAFETGLRAGELAAVKAEDIDEDFIHVHRQEITYKDGEAFRYEVVEYTKSDAGDRQVVLTDRAKEIIEELKVINPNGTYLTRKDKTHKMEFTRKLYQICDHVGIERRSMHKIRKTYGTMLIDAGVDKNIVMEQMGHADISTTLKHYYAGRRNDTEIIKQVSTALR